MLLMYLLVLDCFGAYVNFMMPLRAVGDSVILLFYFVKFGYYMVSLVTWVMCVLILLIS